MERFLTSGIQRAMLYERKLGHAIVPRKRKARKAKPEPEQEGLFSVSCCSVVKGTKPKFCFKHNVNTLYHFRVVIVVPLISVILCYSASLSLPRCVLLFPC